MQWVKDIRGHHLSSRALMEYLLVWDLLAGVILSTTVPDQFKWTPSASGSYSSKSAYDHLFEGSVKFKPANRIWRSCALPRCKFFIWLAALNRCWISDRLDRRGLDHPECCPLCAQEQETIEHLLVTCVFGEIWYRVLSFVGLQQLSPSLDEESFQDWWAKTEDRVASQRKKGFNSVVILVAWGLWKHHNACVFYEASPNVSKLFLDIKGEASLWCMVGDVKLSELWPP